MNKVYVTVDLAGLSEELTKEKEKREISFRDVAAETGLSSTTIWRASVTFQPNESYTFDIGTIAILSYWIDQKADPLRWVSFDWREEEESDE